MAQLKKDHYHYLQTSMGSFLTLWQRELLSGFFYSSPLCFSLQLYLIYLHSHRTYCLVLHVLKCYVNEVILPIFCYLL